MMRKMNSVSLDERLEIHKAEVLANLKPQYQFTQQNHIGKGQMKKFEIKNKIMIEPDMFYSEAFKCLSASAIRTLMRCLQKRKWGKEKVKGKKRIVYYDDEGFIFPYTEAGFLGIGTTQFWKNIKKLVEIGFLDVEHQGGWYQKNDKEKNYSVYKLSERWKKYGQPDFENIVKPKTLPEDFHIRQNIKRKKFKVTLQKRREHLHSCEDVVAKQGDDRLHEKEVSPKRWIRRECLGGSV
jgi:hypothetical protein